MYSLVRWSYRKLTSRPKRTIAIFGIEDAGKTALMDCFSCMFRQMVYDLVPTMGQQFTSFVSKSIQFDVLDFCGVRTFRSTWNYFCEDLSAFVYVVDSSTCQGYSRLCESLSAVQNLIQTPEASTLPFILVFSKCDTSPAHHAADDGATGVADWIRFIAGCPPSVRIVFCSSKSFCQSQPALTVDLSAQMTLDSRLPEAHDDEHRQPNGSTEPSLSAAAASPASTLEKQDDLVHVTIHVRNQESEDVSIHLDVSEDLGPDIEKQPDSSSPLDFSSPAPVDAQKHIHQISSSSSFSSSAAQTPLPQSVSFVQTAYHNLRDRCLNSPDLAVSDGGIDSLLSAIHLCIK
eukprot:ANDGO_00817.mRNA.1 ADP-ribosylation factor-like protein 8